jgi:plastocyanin
MLHRWPPETVGSYVNPEPLEIIIGDTVTWIRRDVEVVEKNDAGEEETIEIKASEGWTLKIVAVGKLGTFTITAVADDDDADDFKFSATAAITGAYTAGDYKWQIVATKTTTRYTVAEGWITLADNIAGRSAAYDNRSHAKKMLDAIEAELEGKGTAASMALLSYSIAGRSKTQQVEILVRMRSKYKSEYESEVAAERVKMGLGSQRNVRVRFLG